MSGRLACQPLADAGDRCVLSEEALADDVLRDGLLADVALPVGAGGVLRAAAAVDVFGGVDGRLHGVGPVVGRSGGGVHGRVRGGAQSVAQGRASGRARGIGDRELASVGDAQTGGGSGAVVAPAGAVGAVVAPAGAPGFDGALTRTQWYSTF